MLDDIKAILDNALQLGDAMDNFNLDTPLMGSIAEFDSMAVVTVLTLIEEQFDVVIEDDDVSADNFATVGTLVEFVEAKVG